MKMTVFVLGIRDCPATNKIRDDSLTASRHRRAHWSKCQCVRPEALIEIECVAAIPE